MSIANGVYNDNNEMKNDIDGEYEEVEVSVYDSAQSEMPDAEEVSVEIAESASVGSNSADSATHAEVEVEEYQMDEEDIEELGRTRRHGPRFSSNEVGECKIGDVEEVDVQAVVAGDMDGISYDGGLGSGPDGVDAIHEDIFGDPFGSNDFDSLDNMVSNDSHILF